MTMGSFSHLMRNIIFVVGFPKDHPVFYGPLDPPPHVLRALNMQKGPKTRRATQLGLALPINGREKTNEEKQEQKTHWGPRVFCSLPEYLLSHRPAYGWAGTGLEDGDLSFLDGMAKPKWAARPFSKFVVSS